MNIVISGLPLWPPCIPIVFDVIFRFLAKVSAVLLKPLATKNRKTTFLALGRENVVFLMSQMRTGEGGLK
jgi:hypothetical protein